MRPFKGECDLQKIVDLFDACEQVDKIDLSISVAQLKIELEDPLTNDQEDLMMWENDDQQLIGFGQMWIEEPTEDNTADGRLWFIVHPIARGGDIESQIIAWAEDRLRIVGKERQAQPKLFSWSRSDRVDRTMILKNHDFIEDRYFFHLSRSLSEDISIPALPKGFILRTVQGEQDIQAWVDLHNKSFLNQWNYHPLTLESRKYEIQNPNYLPELDLVAVTPEGNFAAICYCAIYSEHNTFLGRQEGWIAHLCTSPDYQRQGLGRSMLWHGLRQLQVLNMEIAKIGVDSENAFDAQKLYKSVGFEHLYTIIAHVKHLSIASPVPSAIN
jgi:mycothiol synthase